MTVKDAHVAFEIRGEGTRSMWIKGYHAMSVPYDKIEYTPVSGWQRVMHSLRHEHFIDFGDVAINVQEISRVDLLEEREREDETLKNS